MTNFSVTSDLEVQIFHQFQGSHGSSGKPFESVLEGFEMDFGRKVLPSGDK